MNFELAGLRDFDDVCAVLEVGDRAQMEQLPDVFTEKTGPVRPRDFLEARILGPESAIWLARDDAKIIGVLEVVLEPKPTRDGVIPRSVALIDNVVVLASHRRRGIATALISTAEAWAKERGVTVMRLNVWSTNPDAKRLYERLGFATRVATMERKV